MKIVQINTFSYKAAGNIMMNIHKHLLQQGIDSYVVWGRGRLAEDSHEYFMNDKLGVYSHGLMTRLKDKTGFYSKNSTKKLVKWLQKISPDIIHLHCLHGYYIHIPVLFEYIKENNIKVVWTQHDCWSFTGHCAYFDMINCNKWVKGCHDCEQLHTYPASFVDRSRENWECKKELFTYHNTIIVTPCNWLKNIMKKSFFKENEIRVIYNGIDTEVFKKKAFVNKNDKKIILGVAGEWTPRKGLNDFVKLNELIDKEKFQIMLVGVTDRQMKELPEDIIKMRRTSSVSELVAIYSNADVFFNPTYEDNFPTTNLEALSCGTPVVTYNTGGSPESISNGVNGYIVKKGDYCTALDIFNNMDLLTPVEFDIHEFSKEAMIKKYLELYYE